MKRNTRLRSTFIGCTYLIIIAVFVGVILERFLGSSYSSIRFPSTGEEPVTELLSPQVEVFQPPVDSPLPISVESPTPAPSSSPIPEEVIIPSPSPSSSPQTEIPSLAPESSPISTESASLSASLSESLIATQASTASASIELITEPSIATSSFEEIFIATGPAQLLEKSLFTLEELLNTLVHPRFNDGTTNIAFYAQCPTQACPGNGTLDSPIFTFFAENSGHGILPFSDYWSPDPSFKKIVAVEYINDNNQFTCSDLSLENCITNSHFVNQFNFEIVPSTPRLPDTGEEKIKKIALWVIVLGILINLIIFIYIRVKIKQNTRKK